MKKPDPTGLTVLITAGEFAGEEAVCLGRAPHTTDRWAVSPNSSQRIVNLRFEIDFGVIINPGQKLGRS
jgi:hypothetical protein